MSRQLCKAVAIGVLAMGSSGAKAQFDASSRSLRFVEQQIGTASAPTIVSITNEWGLGPKEVRATVTFPGFCISPPSQGCLERVAEDIASFVIESSCGVLDPGQSCSLFLRFVPAAARDLRAEIVLGADPAGKPVVVQLQGYGVPRKAVPGTVLAVEYARADPPRLFLTVLRDEIDKLDRNEIKGWQRTGKTFWVHPSGEDIAANTRPVCRFYGLPEAGLDRHFYSASPAECAEVIARFSYAWLLEGGDFFRVVLPDIQSGACVPGTSPLYRLYAASTGVQHIYTTMRTEAAALVAQGWIAEGYGPDAVAMCVPQ